MILNPYHFTGDPNGVPGLVAWYDASDASTFTFSSGSVVSQWNDKSGNTNHLTQGTVTNQPSRSGTQNGLLTVTFDGVDNFMICAGLNTLFNGSSDITVCAAYRRPTIANAVLVGSQAAATDRGILIFHPSGSSCSARISNPVFNTTRPHTSITGVTRVLVSSLDANGPQYVPTHRSQGASTSDIETNAAALAPAASGFAMGARSSVASLFADMQVFELCIFSNVISGSSISLMETYLNNKWACF